MEIPAETGSYIIVGGLIDETRFTSGPFSGQLLSCGYYLYSGSAFGKGGLSARIARHLNPDTKKFWHFDHLKTYMQIVEIWYSTNKINQECHFIKAMQEMEDFSFPFPNFGSGDCHHGCPSHLVRIPQSAIITTAYYHLINYGFSLQRLTLK